MELPKEGAKRAGEKFISAADPFVSDMTLAKSVRTRKGQSAAPREEKARERRAYVPTAFDKTAREPVKPVLPDKQAASGEAVTVGSEKDEATGEVTKGAGGQAASEAAALENSTPAVQATVGEAASATPAESAAVTADPESAAQSPETAALETEKSRERAMIGYLAEAIGGSRLVAECKYFHPFLAASVACALCALLLLAPLVSLYCASGLCYIYENGNLEGVSVAAADDPEGAFEGARVELRAADEVDTEMLGTTALMSVRRAHDITVAADGKIYEHRVLGKNAREALAELGITVGENDRVSPDDGAPLADGDTVTLERVSYEYREVTESVPWETVTKLSPLITEGETLVMDEGEQRDGVAFRTYRDTYVDGALETSEIVEEVYDKYPWDLVYLKGKDDAAMSPIEGAKYTDIPIVNNAPAEYERVLENGVCTAYSFNPGTWGASGMYLVQGFVAVDTSVIPYGSLLYITSPTGKFTYGWAIAADVGEAMVAGYVDIDLFFETYRESALFGKHKMNIYVVKQLTQGELEEYIANEGMFRKRVPQ